MMGELKGRAELGAGENPTMTDDMLILHEKPDVQYMIAGWRRQWSDGGEISGGLPRYLIATSPGQSAPNASSEA